jgi:hypothetical protein
MTSNVKVLFNADKKDIVITYPRDSFTPSVVFSNSISNQKKSEPSQLLGPAQIFNKDVFIRIRTDMSIEGLQIKYKTVDIDVLKRTLDVIKTTNCEQVNQADIINWGYEVQKKYGEFVDKINDICNNQQIELSKRLINEIGSLIEEIVYPKFLTKMFGKTPSFSLAYTQIKDKNWDLQNKIGMLQTLIADINSMLNELKELKNDVEVHLIAAAELSDNMEDQYKNILLSRQASLTSTKLQFISSETQLNTLKDVLIKIISIIQDTLAVEVPLWVNSQILSSKIKNNKLLDTLNEIS